jgi:hypothetical protein
VNLRVARQLDLLGGAYTFCNWCEYELAIITSCRLRVFENKVTRKTLISRREERSMRWEKFYNEKFYNAYISDQSKWDEMAWTTNMLCRDEKFLGTYHFSRKA